MKFALFVGLALASVSQVVWGADACLRGDRIDRISMVDPRTALAGSLDGSTYRITFINQCGARHVGVFFITNPDHLPTCIGPGTGLRTNSEGACTVKSISRL